MAPALRPGIFENPSSDIITTYFHGDAGNIIHRIVEYVGPAMMTLPTREYALLTQHTSTRYPVNILIAMKMPEHVTR